MSQETFEITTYHAHITQGSPESYFWIGAFIVICIVIYYLIAVLFSLSIYKLAKRIDKDKQIFPAWFAWMFLIPIVGYVFRWMMLPFGIGKALKHYDSAEIRKKGSTLFGLGLSVVILPLISWISFLSIAVAIASIVLFILYWVKAVQTRKLLEKQLSSDHQSLDDSEK
ncbi:hypothetical protein [Fangia hongkongensis]|uniref:hypothetical protein n=1 Tax=Fangia hongkongensis TaxID=270495 RepID=UPI0003657590|nr:hypothetical protein [Fangia hongkongensis]MBK2123715.1 hypothetical protein [Fangia hongkongensis]